jgi:hypothetical protein
MRCFIERAMKAQSGRKDTALLFLSPRRKMGVGDQRQAPAALPPVGGWVGPRADLDGCEKSPPPHLDSTPDRPARSESLYGLRYPGPCFATSTYKKSG